MWVAIASIVMMFGGLTSGYIVKRNQANWQTFDLPVEFWYSTAAILLSSVALWFAGKAFKQRQLPKYSLLLLVAFFLGIGFIVLQVLGFVNLWHQGITFTKNVSYSFLYTLVGVHAAHVVGGIIALLVLVVKSFNSSRRNYNAVGLEVVSTYWHFVDVLWVYLLVFLMMIR